MKTKNLNKGLGMVEIIVVIAIVTIAFTAILQLFRLEVRTERLKRDELRAYALLAEAQEAVRAVRDNNWNSLSSLTIGADYYPLISGGAWTLSSLDPGPIDGYSKRIVLSSVQRDAGSNLVSSGGTVDIDTLKVTAYIEWQSGGSAKTKTLTTYLTNWQSKL